MDPIHLFKHFDEAYNHYQMYKPLYTADLADIVLVLVMISVLAFVMFLQWPQKLRPTSRSGAWLGIFVSTMVVSALGYFSIHVLSTGQIKCFNVSRSHHACRGDYFFGADGHFHEPEEQLLSLGRDPFGFWFHYIYIGMATSLFFASWMASVESLFRVRSQSQLDRIRALRQADSGVQPSTLRQHSTKPSRDAGVLAPLAIPALALLMTFGWLHHKRSAVHAAIAAIPPDPCKFKGLRVPGNTEALAVSGYSGRVRPEIEDLENDDPDGDYADGDYAESDYPESNDPDSEAAAGEDHPTFPIDVTVNYPGVPVALVLTSHDSTAWHVHAMPGTRILAIVASGIHRQVLADHPAGVPFKIGSKDTGDPCGAFYGTADDRWTMNFTTQKVFGLSVKRVYPVAKGKAVVSRL